jgi:predicted transcriptional regulator
MGDFKGISHTGFSTDFIKSMVDKYALWQKPLEDICRRAPQIKVKDIMYTPTEGEYVHEEATLDQALHQLVVGHHQSLLVTKDGKEIVGILRLTDVFQEVCGMIKACDM